MTPPAKVTWILVAHRTGAVIYESRGPGRPLTRVSQRENPMGRLRTGAIDSDRPGRAFDRVGGGRHAMSPEESAYDRIAHRFVLELADELEQGRARNAFDRLALIAPAKLLGALRDALPKPLQAMVVATLAKDLAHTNGDEVRSALSDQALV